VKNEDSSRRTITRKDYVYQSLNKELERIQDEFIKENEKCIEEYMDLHKKDEQTIKQLEYELKHRLKVFDIPPLRTVISQEAILMAEVNKKNKIIEIMKDQFRDSLVENYNKHQFEINEYKEKEEELKGKIVELEKITAEL